MKSWLRNERVYRAIMNGTLWAALLAALANGKWPQFGWAAGCMTALMVVIAATVYCITPREDEREGSRPETDERPREIELTATQGGGSQFHDQMPEKPEELVPATRSLKQWMHLTQQAYSTEEVEKWAARRSLLENPSLAAQWERFLSYSAAPHHGTEFSKARRIYYFAPGSGKSSSRNLAISSGEEEANRVVFNVGSVRIEITEEEKTTNIQITSPKSTLVTSNAVDTHSTPEMPTKNPSTIH